MIAQNLQTAGRRAAAFARKLAADTSGVAALETALVLPFLLLLLLGTVEIARSVDADRKFGNATAMTTDLVAREETIDTAGLDGMMAAINHLMSPYDGDALSLGIIAVRAPIDPAQQPVVEWSYSHKGKTVPAKCANYTLPDGIVGPGGRVIVVESSFRFVPLFANWEKNPLPGIEGGALTWSDRATMTPRKDCVHNSSQQTSASRCDFSCP